MPPPQKKTHERSKKEEEDAFCKNDDDGLNRICNGFCTVLLTWALLRGQLLLYIS
jgi:hypothetical protein